MRRYFAIAGSLALAVLLAQPAQAQKASDDSINDSATEESLAEEAQEPPRPQAPRNAFVPGTGAFLANCSDDFEDEKWSYSLRLPKSSYEQDDNQRGPGGVSSNGLWHEGAKRGTPDVVRLVATPEGGIEGSLVSLLMQTKNSGMPGRITNEQMQDDLLMKFDSKLGRPIPVEWRPSCTVRVYVPEFEQWENRTGASFGMRADCRGKTPQGETDAYWPGMFLLFRSETSRNVEQDYAQISIRSNQRGQDIRSLNITEPGWWTMGLSFSPDGMIHYYASPGVDDLTEEDYLASSYPYNYKCLCLRNFFFNVANWDNGKSWSTPWVIDDPKVFVQPPAGLAVSDIYRKKGQRVPMYPVTKKSDEEHGKYSKRSAFGLFR
jgi:hypothetical protein